MKYLIICIILSGCNQFVPAYQGEPECGSPAAIHAVEGSRCFGSIQVACDCHERETLECVDGVWSRRHWGCSAGLDISIR